MKKISLIVFFLVFPLNLYADNMSKVYFAGGCFWCMEESFDKVDGVVQTISGYSGGHVKNPKYKESIILRLNSSKARKELSWRPKFTIIQTLNKTADWYNSFIKNENIMEKSLYDIEEYFN